MTKTTTTTTTTTISTTANIPTCVKLEGISSPTTTQINTTASPATTIHQGTHDWFCATLPTRGYLERKEEILGRGSEEVWYRRKSIGRAGCMATDRTTTREVEDLEEVSEFPFFASWSKLLGTGIGIGGCRPWIGFSTSSPITSVYSITTYL